MRQQIRSITLFLKNRSLLQTYLCDVYDKWPLLDYVLGLWHVLQLPVVLRLHSAWHPKVLMVGRDAAHLKLTTNRSRTDVEKTRRWNGKCWCVIKLICRNLEILTKHWRAKRSKWIIKNINFVSVRLESHVNVAANLTQTEGPRSAWEWKHFSHARE